MCLFQVYSGKRCAQKEVEISNVTESPDVVGHMVVFDDNERARFGEVFEVENSRLRVRLYRRMGEILHPVSTRTGQHVEKLIERNCVREESVFVLSTSKRIPKRIKLLLANEENH